MIVAYRVQNGWLVHQLEGNGGTSGYFHASQLAQFHVFDSLKAMTDHFRCLDKAEQSKRATDSAARGKGAWRKR